MWNSISKFQVVIVIVWVVGLLGWVSNINQLIRCDFEKPYKAEVIRSIGVVVVPIGAVAGFFKIDDTPEKE